MNEKEEEKKKRREENIRIKIYSPPAILSFAFMMIRRKERRTKVAERRKEAEQGGQNENEQRDEIYDRFMTHLSKVPYPTNQPKPG